MSSTLTHIKLIIKNINYLISNLKNFFLIKFIEAKEKLVPKTGFPDKNPSKTHKTDHLIDFHQVYIKQRGKRVKGKFSCCQFMVQYQNMSKSPLDIPGETSFQLARHDILTSI